jgi:hypothetical protein
MKQVGPEDEWRYTYPSTYSFIILKEKSQGCIIGDHDEYCLTDRWTDI